MQAKTTTQRRRRFERLIRQAEDLIESNPRAYRLRLLLLALLGYAVLFGLLFSLLALVFGAI